MTAHWVHSKNFLFAAFLISIALGGAASFRRQQAMLTGPSFDNVLPSARPPGALTPGAAPGATPLYRQFKEACECGDCREACRLYRALKHRGNLTARQQEDCRTVLTRLTLCPMR
jgi:hypothetical protein